jgi:hypothetical protein
MGLITTAPNMTRQEDSGTGGPSRQKLRSTRRRLASLTNMRSTLLWVLTTRHFISMGSSLLARMSLTLAVFMLPSSPGTSVAALVRSCQFLQTSRRNRYFSCRMRMPGAGIAHQNQRLKGYTATLTLLLEFVSW